MFSRKIRVLNPLSSYDSISNFEDYINHYIYNLFLLGGTLVLNELHFDSGEQRQLNELLFKGSSESQSPVPKIVGLAEFLTSAIPIISSSFELLFDRYLQNTKLIQERRRRTDKASMIIQDRHLLLRRMILALNK